jgi:MFS family permease
VVIVREQMAQSQTVYALVLAAYGMGSMLMAFGLGTLLKRWSERSAMIGAAFALAGLLCLLTAVAASRGFNLAFVVGRWFALGAAYSLCVTPSGRLLRKSSGPQDRPLLFAAHFSLSHACWLIAYPLAGWLGAEWGQTVALAGMAALSLAGCVGALLLWPSTDDERVRHSHPNLQDDHPHIIAHHLPGNEAHAFYIDELHDTWPKQR